MLEGVPLIEGVLLTASAAGFEPCQQPQPTSADWNLELVLAGPGSAAARLVGRVLDPERQAVPQAWVVLGETHARTDGEGRFELFASLAPGEPRRLLVAAEGFLPLELGGRSGGALAEAWSQPLELVFVARSGTLSGVLLDDAGEPVVGALVSTPDTREFGRLPFDDQNSFLVGWSIEDVAGGQAGVFATTDETGRFELLGLEPRAYRLRARDASTGRAVESGPVLPGSPVELRLPASAPMRPVAGRLLDFDGNPVAGVLVAFRHDVFGEPIDEFRIQTDERGRFELDGVPESVYAIVVWGEPVAEEHVRELDAGESWTGLAMRLPRYCHLQVDARGLPAAQSFAVLDADGEPVLLRSKHGWVESGDWQRGFDAGLSEMHRMTELGVTLVVSDGEGRELLRQAVELDPDEPLILRL